MRTVWWVYGVGPVKTVFDHAGAGLPDHDVGPDEHQSTPTAPPPDTRWFPLDEGRRRPYRWTNSKHMKKPSVQEFTTDEVRERLGRVTVKHISGPIRVAGAYGFTTRARTASRTSGRRRNRRRSPASAARPGRCRRTVDATLLTPLDMMVFGFNPIIPAASDVRRRRGRRRCPAVTYSIFGVTGTSKVLGVKTVKVPAGTFKALVVQSKLKQKGFPLRKRHEDDVVRGRTRVS